MSLLTRELLAKAAKQDANRQRQITAQKEIIDRLLVARESEASDADLIRELCEERRVLNEEKLLLQARFERLTSLLEAEAGANIISVDLIHEALNG